MVKSYPYAVKRYRGDMYDMLFDESFRTISLAISYSTQSEREEQIKGWGQSGGGGGQRKAIAIGLHVRTDADA